jgi:aminoglycoside/choline kinase family phosphotransferase
MLIDFQGMRFGPAAYDLASLLCDPYIPVDDAVRQRLLCYYKERSRPGTLPDGSFERAAVQRLAQALGAYGRLARNAATVRFRVYMRPALLNMQQQLKRLGTYPALEGVIGAGLEAASGEDDGKDEA